jgi:hypothetical protein
VQSASKKMFLFLFFYFILIIIISAATPHPYYMHAVCEYVNLLSYNFTIKICFLDLNFPKCLVYAFVSKKLKGCLEHPQQIVVIIYDLDQLQSRKLGTDLWISSCSPYKRITTSPLRLRPVDWILGGLLS